MVEHSHEILSSEENATTTRFLRSGLESNSRTFPLPSPPLSLRVIATNVHPMIMYVINFIED